MVKNLFIISWFLFLAAFDLSSQSVSANAFADKSEYEVGDYIHFTIEILHKQDLRVFPPPIADYAKSIDVIRTDEPIVEDTKGGKKIICRYIISKYDSGDVVIPPIPVLYHLGRDTTSLSVFTNPVQFSVRTLQVNTAEDIKDIKPPIKIPFDLLTLIIIASIIILIILAALYYYRAQQKKKQKKVERRRVYLIPPHVKALTALNELEGKKLWQQGLIKEYHSTITEIIRRYFEERFNILALESSTSEIMEQLTRVVLPEDIYKTVNDFLNNADLVKFAKYKPLPSVNEEMMKQAIHIVENTVPVKYESTTMEKADV